MTNLTNYQLWGDDQTGFHKHKCKYCEVEYDCNRECPGRNKPTIPGICGDCRKHQMWTKKRVNPKVKSESQ